LIAYIQAKITDPLSVNPAARMPQFHLEADDLAEITTELLSMNGEPPAPAVARNLLPAPHAEFHPAGDFGELYERYKCYVCHRFNGFGGTLAPDLSYEGSRAQRKWLIEFLKHPQTLRPTLTSRMPQFNMTHQEASSLADFLALALQAPRVNPARAHLKEYTPEMVALGKQLYTVKYQCQECHTIGSTGGYVGANLTNAGNWFNAAWIEEWLRNPQALVPGTIEPRRSFTDQEVTALAAYLMTLKQGVPAGGASAGAGTAR
jgi:nitric oxide reductase subunit C